MRRKFEIENTLYIPIKLNNGKFEYMFDTHGKIKVYKSMKSLKKYTKGYSTIAVYKLEEESGSIFN